MYIAAVMSSLAVGNAPWPNTAAVQILLSPRSPFVRVYLHIYIIDLYTG